MPNVKHYVLTSITLGAIALVSAAAIGLTNMFTNKQIAQNEENKTNLAISDIFGEGASIAKESSLADFEIENNYSYVGTVYTVNLGEDLLGYGFRTSGSNAYGKIVLIVGFTVATNSFKGLYAVVNEQSYASTLVDNYITPLNAGDRNVDDVSCGATYGAKLVRDMVSEAQDAVSKINKV